jgi:uncharacterized membrane protein
MRPRQRIAIALAILVAVAAGILVATGVEGQPGISDTPVYERYGERIVSGDVPYRDFRVEYPPGALVAFVVPALLADSHDAYDAAFAALMIAALAAVAVLLLVAAEALGRSLRATALALALFLGGFLLLGPFTLTRFDLLAAAVTAAAVTALLRGHDRLGAVVLGIAIATKIYPAVLLPLVVARAWRAGGRAAGLQQAAITVGTAALVYLPFLVMAPAGVARSVWQQLGRPLQIESLGAAVLLALHQAVGMPLGWASGHGSQNLTGAVAGIASALTTIAGAAALVAVWILFARGGTDDERFVRHAAAAVVAFVAFGKVLSPQFLIWLLPMVVLVAGRRAAVASCLMLLSCALTRLWFPGHYWELVKQFEPRSSWLVLLRDVVLVGVFVLLARPERGRAEPGVSQAGTLSTF